MPLNCGSDAIKAAEVWRVVHEALGGQGPNPHTTGL
jgi:hypothetical protein